MLQDLERVRSNALQVRKTTNFPVEILLTNKYTNKTKTKQQQINYKKQQKHLWKKSLAFQEIITYGRNPVTFVEQLRVSDLLSAAFNQTPSTFSIFNRLTFQ